MGPRSQRSCSHVSDEPSEGATRLSETSLKRGTDHDSGKANSPLTLSDDDSEEILIFHLVNSTTSSSGGNTGGGIPNLQQGGGTNGVLITLAMGLVVLIGLFFWSRGTGSRGGITGAVAGFISSPVVIAGLIVLAVVVAMKYNVLALPPTTQMVAAIAGFLVATYLVLRRLDAFSWRVFAVVAFVVAVLGSETIRPGLLETLIGSDGFQRTIPLLAIAGAYLAYKGVQAWRRGQVTKIVVGGSGGS